MRPELVDATLRRKQEEKRRQEIGYNSEVVIFLTLRENRFC